MSNFINKESLHAFTWLNKAFDSDYWTYSRGNPKHSIYLIIASIFILSFSGFLKKLFLVVSL
jgi:hypothetical protein